MKKDNVILQKSYSFAIDVVKLYRHLCYDKKEYVLSKQLVRCGTSIGANVEEAVGGQSEKDFVSKMKIAYKEARETHYWLRLLRDSGDLEESHAAPALKECEELLKIITKILNTMKDKMSRQL